MLKHCSLAYSQFPPLVDSLDGAGESLPRGADGSLPSGAAGGRFVIGGSLSAAGREVTCSHLLIFDGSRESANSEISLIIVRSTRGWGVGAMVRNNLNYEALLVKRQEGHVEPVEKFKFTAVYDYILQS